VTLLPRLREEVVVLNQLIHRFGEEAEGSFLILIHRFADEAAGVARQVSLLKR
jgi:hypothetical protein